VFKCCYARLAPKIEQEKKGNNIPQQKERKGDFLLGKCPNKHAMLLFSYLFNIPRNHCEFHHRISSLAQGASQNTHQQSWCLSFSVPKTSKNK
jgi:hypothetical protein